MMQPNIILLTLDEIRADDLGCYGQRKIETPYIDSWANEGVVFEECRAVSSFTPVCLATVLSGTYPNKHGRRDAFRLFTPPMTIAEILKTSDYKTAAWTSAELLVSKYGYDAGFDEFYEPVEYLGMRAFYPEYGSLSDGEFNKRMLKIHSDAQALDPRQETEIAPELLLPPVYWWINDVISWLEKNKGEKFFVWCHLYETHVGCEKFLLHHGLLKIGENSENNYHLGKVVMVDDFIVKPIIKTMKKLGLYEDTIMIMQSDHGTHLHGHAGERPLPPLYFATYKGSYPSHPSLYDADVRVASIWRGPGIPKNVKVKGQVRTVDTVPTVLGLCGIAPPEKAELDGVSLIPIIEKREADGLLAYMEHLHEGRVMGCQQGLCTGRYKFIRSLTTGSEELYDLEYDPNEYVNLLNSSVVPYGKFRKSTVLEDPINSETLVEWRRKLNRYLLDVPPPTRTIRKPKRALDEKGLKEVERRLASLGYIQREE